MADLSYQDVQQATNDSVRPLHNDIQRLASDISTTSSRTQTRLDDLQHALQRLEDDVSRLETRSEQSLQPINHDIQDLKARFATIERFCQDMSDYLQNQVASQRIEP